MTDPNENLRKTLLRVASEETKLSSREATLQRRRDFGDHFVREHHPGLVDMRKIEGAHSLMLLDAPRRIDIDSSWWLQTSESMTELDFTYLAYLFDRHNLLDHAWMIYRSDREPCALVSELYAEASWPSVEALRRELEQVGTECWCIRPSNPHTIQAERCP